MMRERAEPAGRGRAMAGKRDGQSCVSQPLYRWLPSLALLYTAAAEPLCGSVLQSGPDCSHLGARPPPQLGRGEHNASEKRPPAETGQQKSRDVTEALEVLSCGTESHCASGPNRRQLIEPRSPLHQRWPAGSKVGAQEPTRKQAAHKDLQAPKPRPRRCDAKSDDENSHREPDIELFGGGCRRSLWDLAQKKSSAVLQGETPSCPLYALLPALAPSPLSSCIAHRIAIRRYQLAI